VVDFTMFRQLFELSVQLVFPPTGFLLSSYIERFDFLQLPVKQVEKGLLVILKIFV
jgi:hypothetical protein